MGRAIVRKPQVFLMDEPLSNLDAKLRVQTRTQIASLQRRLGATTVYVTHDQTEALTMGDRIAVLKDGVLQQVGTPRDLYEAPANVFVAGFLGSPAMNLFPAKIVPGGVNFGTDTAKVPANVIKATNHPNVTIGVRPEDLEVSTSNKGIKMIVHVIEELGADGYLYGEAESAGEKMDVIVRVDGRDHPKIGDAVHITPKPAHIHVFDVMSGLRLG
jgi:multiple sugar transport system ATP-binding protein